MNEFYPTLPNSIQDAIQQQPGYVRGGEGAVQETIAQALQRMMDEQIVPDNIAITFR